MGKVYRSDRLAEEIRKIVGEMLISGIKDPRISGKFISISSVDVTRDVSYATCYITVLGANMSEDGISEEEQQEREDVIEGLNSASGLIKREIGRRVKVRHIPELIFKIDTSMDYGRHIDKVIKELNSDEK